MKEEIINKLIKWFKVDTNKISDGYHTFEELYDHRCLLFINLCEHTKGWRSLKHSDGSVWDGWFIMGTRNGKGQQMTYHLPMKFWDMAMPSVRVLDEAPEWDGHTPADVLERLRSVKY